MHTNFFIIIRPRRTDKSSAQLIKQFDKIHAISQFVYRVISWFPYLWKWKSFLTGLIATSAPFNNKADRVFIPAKCWEGRFTPKVVSEDDFTPAMISACRLNLALTSKGNLNPATILKAPAICSRELFHSHDDFRVLFKSQP